MADTSSPSVNLITDLIGRYGKQAIQVFTTLAGAASLFYAIGFIIVNTRLLQLGVYESALISVGYVAPGVAFALVFMLSAAGGVGLTTAAFATLTPLNARRIGSMLPARLRGATDRMKRPAKYVIAVVASVVVMIVNVVLIVALSKLIGFGVWFGLNEAVRVTVWCLGVSAVSASLLYAEYLVLLRRSFHQQIDPSHSLLASAQARLRQPMFVVFLAALVFVSVLAYGRFVYGDMPSVFGGGLPIVVRFFGEKVNKLDRLGIGLEPGETDLTERIELIAQTEDRYIVRVAGRAISFDKSFVQGVRYEPPEFFLDEAFFLTKHTRQGEQYFADQLYDDALSEFNLVLQHNSAYAPALHARIRVALIETRLDLDEAFDDYRTLTRVERNDAEDFYGFAKVQVLRSQARKEPIEVTEVVAALQQVQTISPTLIERARGDAVFSPLRQDARFDVPVYGSGPAAARWFRDSAKAKLDGGPTDAAIADLQSAVAYAEKYRTDSDALSTTEIADLHATLSGLYSSTSDQALAELQAAVDATGQRDPTYLNWLAEALVARGDITRALATYDRVLGLTTADDPNKRQALIGQGRAALESGKYVPARAAFEKALALSSSDASTLYDYARTLAAVGDEGTEKALRDAIALDLSLAEKAQADDWQKYFANAGTAVANLINGAVFARQARTARDQGDLDTAITRYQSATQSEPNVSLYWDELGDVLFRAKRYAESAVAYQNAIQYAGSPDASRLIALGRARIADGHAAEAIQAFGDAINAQGSAATADTYVLLANAHESAQQYVQAAAAYGEAAQRDSLNVIYPYRRGIDLMLADRREDGLAALDRTIKQGGLLQVVASAGSSLRDAPGDTGVITGTLSVGAVLKIAGAPDVVELKIAGAPVVQRQVWWPVADQNNVAGWVNASDVVPAEQTIPPAIQSNVP